VAAYDANIRCPFIVSMPAQLPSGKTCASPVSGVEVAPTFFSFAGIDLPWEMHGRDLTPLLKKPEQAKKRSVLTVFTGRKYGSDANAIPTDLKELRKVAQVPWCASPHDGRDKYIRTFEEDEIEELYDLREDPAELTNLALLKKHGARLAKMRAQTITELRRTKPGFVDHLPPTGTDKRTKGD
jgi:arylsulfatase A-like enzyme